LHVFIVIIVIFLKIYISRGSVASMDAVKVWWYIY